MCMVLHWGRPGEEAREWEAEEQEEEGGGPLVGRLPGTRAPQQGQSSVARFFLKCRNDFRIVRESNPKRFSSEITALCLLSLISLLVARDLRLREEVEGSSHGTNSGA